MADKDDLLLQDILDHAREALAYLEGVDLDDYLDDRRLQLATERLLEIIGEAAGGLSTEARDRIDLDWPNIRGLRNIIAHQYGNVHQPTLYTTAVRHLPGLVDAITAAR